MDVTDNRAAHRFELATDAGIAFAAYTVEGDRITFTHTVVPEAAEGHGVGSTLIDGALQQANDAGMRVVARCPFVAAYIERHPRWRDLLA